MQRKSKTFLVLGCMSLLFSLWPAGPVPAFPLLSTPAVSVTAPANVLVNGSPLVLDPSPVIVNGRVMVPARPLAAAMQAQVDWDSAGRSLMIARGIYRVGLIIGSNKAYANELPASLDGAPLIRDNQAMVPVRFVTEALGGQVEWADGRIVSITIPAEQPNSTNNTANTAGIWAALRQGGPS